MERIAALHRADHPAQADEQLDRQQHDGSCNGHQHQHSGPIRQRQLVADAHELHDDVGIRQQEHRTHDDACKADPHHHDDHDQQDIDRRRQRPPLSLHSTISFASMMIVDMILIEERQ